jgi:transcriptional regulator with XRE-family HTH domain
LNNSLFDDEGAMAEVVSPTVARRRVRLALREAREAAGRTQLEVAEEMEWSLSKVIRIENGDVSISPNDLRPLMSYLGFREREQINALLADAKVARMRGHVSWWQDPEYRELPGELRRFFEYEAVAVEIRNFSIRYIPGPLQIPEYATALTAPLEDELGEYRSSAVVSARSLRRESVLSRLGSTLKYYAVLDEGVFMRSTGGTAVFAAQLSEMHSLAKRGLVQIRMLPFSLDVPIANNAAFDLLSLDERAGSEVMYRENGVVDELVEDKPSTMRHLNRFQYLWEQATDEAGTIEFMGHRIKQLERDNR